jgi:hypothetical protein
MCAVSTVTPLNFVKAIKLLLNIEFKYDRNTWFEFEFHFFLGPSPSLETIVGSLVVRKSSNLFTSLPEHQIKRDLK